MRTAQDALGTWELYSWEPEESVVLLLAYSLILRILYQYLWAKASMCLKKVQAFGSGSALAMGLSGRATWTEPLVFSSRSHSISPPGGPVVPTGQLSQRVTL